MKRFFCFSICFLILIYSIRYECYCEYNYDLIVKSNVTEDQLSNSLYDNLSKLSSVFIECEKEFGVNAIIISSIAALESGWGKSNLAKENNNLFGWKNSDGSYKKFDSFSECIYEVSESISKNYLDKNGKYYSGGTEIDHIAKLYSESEDWKDKVKEIHDQILERCEKYEEK